MDLDVVLLSRIQFALTIGFHFLFPPISIGLAWLLVIAETVSWRREDEDYGRIGKFFARLLGLTFAVGVATGIVMEFQLGMNWAKYSTFVGDIFGAPLAAEGERFNLGRIILTICNHFCHILFREVSCQDVPISRK